MKKDMNSPLRGFCTYSRARRAWNSGLDIQYRENGEWVDFTRSSDMKLPIKAWGFPEFWRIKDPDAD